ncbi:hypothetical protein ABIB56_001263 [Glaciihabitans sp. UYNi722]
MALHYPSIHYGSSGTYLPVKEKHPHGICHL